MAHDTPSHSLKVLKDSEGTLATYVKKLLRTRGIFNTHKKRYLIRHMTSQISERANKINSFSLYTRTKFLYYIFPHMTPDEKKEATLQAKPQQKKTQLTIPTKDNESASVS
ncbi:hypothetical protein E2C01_056349 [Portunus trituberculatus]|uniref:Uncharacterized protein n=1 Tax=Portunus trituberculatus TaxID=210409 RepID=A0A5B7GXG2_PORTR|nr:hypothetical protein [Portunus trituberculatus]